MEAPALCQGPSLKQHGGLARGGGAGAAAQTKATKTKTSKEGRREIAIYRPLSEEHKNKRRKLKQLELGQMMRRAPDKGGRRGGRRALSHRANSISARRALANKRTPPEP